MTAARTFAKGDAIVQEGEPGHEMFVVLAGQVAVFRRTETGPRQVTTIGAGGIFGELALVEDRVRSASVVAMDDDTRVIALDQARFVHMISQQPAFALFVIQALGRRIRDLDHNLSAEG